VRRILTGTTVAAAVLAVSLTSGCSAVGKALDCADTAVTVAGAVNDLQQAVSQAPDDPQQAGQILDRIDQDLNTLRDSTGDPDVGEAVRHLNEAVTDARTAVDEGRTPDVGPVGDAADELSAVCSPA
jgi:outer membrane murein-binding lipoprotein Lpp